MEIIAKFYPHIWSQKLIDQIVITSEVVIKEEIKGVGEAEFVMPIAPGIKEECKVELYESNGNEDNLLFRGYIHEINPVWGQFQSLKIIARGEKAIFHKRKTLRKHTFTAQALSSILQKLIEPYNTEFNEDWGFEIQKEETLTLEIAQGDDYYDIFDEICEQKELFWTVVEGTVYFKKYGEDLRETQILEYDGNSPNPWNITNIELIGTASGGNVVLVEDSRWNLTVDKSQYSGVLTGVISKQIRKGDDSEKAKQFAKEQARPQRKYQIQVANSSIIANLWDRIKVEVVNTNSFYDYSGEAIVQSKTTSYSNASKVVVYGIQEFLVSPFTAENRVENVEKSIKLLRQRKGGGETPAPQVDLSWYATSSAVSSAIQSQNKKIEQKADSSFVQWVAQTAQTALNTANEAKQTAESKANDSDVVHKSWDEEIGGKKSFNEGVYFDRSFGLNTLDANGNKTKLYWNSLRAPNNHHHILPDLVNQDGGVSSIYIGYNGQQNEIGLSVKWKTNYLLIKDDLNMYINDQNRTGERKDYTPTVTAWQGSPTLNYSSGRYKQIGKIVHCYARAEIKRNNWWGRFWISLPILAKDYGEIISGISLVGRIGTKQESTYWYITAGGATAQILSWIWSAAHMGNLPETFQIHINLTYESQ